MRSAIFIHKGSFQMILKRWAFILISFEKYTLNMVSQYFIAV